MRLERPSLEEEERVIDGWAVQCPDLTPVCCDIELLLGRCVASAASPAACYRSITVGSQWSCSASWWNWPPSWSL